MGHEGYGKEKRRKGKMLSSGIYIFYYFTIKSREVTGSSRGMPTHGPRFFCKSCQDKL